MKIRRLMAGVCALSLALGLSACGTDSAGTTETEATTSETTTFTTKVQDESIKQEIADIAQDDEVNQVLTGDLENKTIKFFSTWDINPDGTGKDVPIDLQLFQERYGGSIEWISTTWDTRYSDMSTYVLGGEGIDFFPTNDMDNFPKGAVNGMYVPYDNYVDFSSELWAPVQTINDQFMWMGGHYLIVLSADAGVVCMYNKQTIEENGFDDPAELLEKGEWTWDTFKDMMMEFTNPEEGYYGIDGYWTEAALLLTTGVPAVELKNGKMVSNLSSPDLERVLNFQYELNTNHINLPKVEFDWAEQPARVGEGKTLFYPIGFYKLYMTKDQWSADLGEDVGFVPMPKDPEADNYYLPAGLNSYALLKGGKNPEGVIKYLECKLVTQTNEKAKELGTTMLKNDYGWTDDMVAMKDKIVEMTNEHPMVDFYNGGSDDMKAILDSGESGIRCSLANGREWSEVRLEIEETIDALIEDYNAQAEAAAAEQ